MWLIFYSFQENFYWCTLNIQKEIANGECIDIL